MPRKATDKVVAAYVADLRYAHRDCKGKLEAVRKVVEE